MALVCCNAQRMQSNYAEHRLGARGGLTTACSGLARGLGQPLKPIVGLTLPNAIDGTWSVQFGTLGCKTWGDEMDSNNIEGECPKISLADYIQSVLPWPLHKDLPECPNGSKHSYSWRDLGLPGPLYQDSYVCECGTRISVSLDAFLLSALPWPFHKDLPGCPCGSKRKYSWKDLELPRPFYKDNSVCKCGTRINIPLDALLLALLPWPYHKSLSNCQCGSKINNPLGDPIKYVLPWSFHKGLPK